MFKVLRWFIIVREKKYKYQFVDTILDYQEFNVCYKLFAKNYLLALKWVTELQLLHLQWTIVSLFRGRLNSSIAFLQPRGHSRRTCICIYMQEREKTVVFQ